MVIVRYSLPSDFFIFSIELYAIKLVINVSHTRKNNNIVIYTNLLEAFSTLKNVQKNSRSHSFAREIFYMTATCNCTIHLVWTSAHTEIIGKEMADAEAKEPLTSTTIPNVPISHTDLKKFIYFRLKHDYNEI